MSDCYRVCGLGLQVNAPIAAWGDVARSAAVDVRVMLGTPPPALCRDPGDGNRFVDSEVDEHGRPYLTVARTGEGCYYRMEFSDGVEVVVAGGGADVWANWRAPATAEDATAYLLGSVLGFVLRLRGITCLHASAVAIGGRAIALAGPSGSGKSSTAAQFARLGYAVLADDLVALGEAHGRFEIQPAFPRVRLWPQTAAALFGSCESLPRIAPRWDKRHLDLDGTALRFQASALPLAAIYFLGERSLEIDSPRIEEVSAPRALIDLVSDSHATEFVGRPERAQEFDSLARLLAIVPARRVTACADMARLAPLCEAIAADFQRLGAAQG